MKILHLSDLHLEFGPLYDPSTDADVVILSGDIHLDTKGIDWASQFDVPVIYVLGNHEAYDSASLEVLVQDCREKAASYPNIHFLENDSVVLDDVRIHGCTLWTDFCLDGTPEESMKVAASKMNDFKCILTQQGRVFTPQDAQRIHAESRRWLYQSIAQSPEAKNVVVTHHLPTRKAIQFEYQGSPLSPAFASHCDEFGKLADKIVIWLYGHNHDCAEFADFGVQFSTNQRGYFPHSLVDGFHTQRTITV